MLKPETIIDSLPFALADDDIAAIHEYCELENYRITRLKQANARVRASRIRAVRAEVIGRVCRANVAEFNRIVLDVAQHSDRITPAIRSGVLPESFD